MAATLTPFELGVGYIMHLWPALSLAVTESWGGPDSSDKRDWFVGSICELFESDPETDCEDVEYRLLQVMQDDFEVAVDDASAHETAENIMKLKQSCGEGDFRELEAWKEKWERRTRGGGSAAAADVRSVFRRIEAGEHDQETDGSDEWEDEEEDVEMGEAPELVRAPREKPVPEIDEDGFTKVVSKKKR